MGLMGTAANVDHILCFDWSFSTSGAPERRWFGRSSCLFPAACCGCGGEIGKSWFPKDGSLCYLLILWVYIIWLIMEKKQYYYFRLLWLDSPVHYQTCHSSILDTIMFRKLIARDVPMDTNSNSYQLMIN